MQLKTTAHLILFTCLVSSLRGKALHPKGCYECEEEVWEEVPCDEIPSNSTTVSTSSTPSFKPTTPSPKPTTLKTTTTPPPKTSTTTTKPHSTTINPDDPYTKCYCQCKLGCKEFCRKVAINPPDKQIVQVSKISEPVAKGRIESTHFLQRELIPESDHSYVKSYHGDDEEPDKDKYSKNDEATPQSIPMPAYAAYHGNVPTEILPHVPTIDYYSKPIAHAIEPNNHAGVNDFLSYASYPPNPPHPPFHNPPIFSRVSKTLLDPVENMQISLDASSKTIGSAAYSKLPIYSSHTPVSNSQWETRGSLGNGLNFDHSLDALIKEFLSDNPSNVAPYQAFSKPFYSVSLSR